MNFFTAHGHVLQQPAGGRRQAAGDKGVKANAYQIILNASRETEDRETEGERRGRLLPIACGCSDIYMQNRKTNFGCGKMHFANLAAWQTDELELETLLPDSVYNRHTHTHIHIRVQVATAFVLQATAISATVANSGAFLFFAPSIFELHWRSIWLATCPAYPLSPCSPLAPLTM